jgi:DNA repair exonuclease SbcCD nuclease subunit
MPFTRYNFKEKLLGLLPQLTSFKRRFLFAHQGVQGAATGPRDIILKDPLQISDFQPEKFDYVFCGHLHKPQRIHPNFVIIGSLIQKDFGERNDKKGYYILDTENPLDLVYYETKAPKFFKINSNAEGEIITPLGHRNGIDFLWAVCPKDVNESVIYNTFHNVRIDKSIDVETSTRTSINISMPREKQLKTYIEFTKTNLDREKLLKLGGDICRRSEL